MSDRSGQTEGDGPHLLLYDGTCGFCDGVVRAVLDRDRTGIFHFASLQSPVGERHLARAGRRPGDLTTFVVVTNYRDHSPAAMAKSSAALFVLTALGWPRTSGLLRTMVPSALLDRAYDLIARHRYRLAGRREVCAAPRPAERDRFIDARGGTVAAPEVQS